MNRYIAIECETGSSGTEIANDVAEALTIPCYGRDILETIAKERSLTQYEMNKYLESISGSVLYSYYLINEVKSNRTAGLQPEGVIYYEHRKKIKELASRGSAVFVGQCATDVLKI